MLKLVRLALTAAVVTAIVVRLRRRARMPETPSPPPPQPPVGKAGMGLVWAGIAAIVAVTLVAALVPTRAHEAASARARAYQAEQDALTAALMSGDDAQPATPLPTGPAVTAFPTPSPTGPPAPVADPDCAPEPRRVRVRPIDPKVKRAVDRQWRRIERWLEANAPRTYKTLGAPGRARTIAIAEAQMGVDFPDDLRASLLRHNGSRGARAFGFGFWWDGAPILGIRQIRDAWRSECSWNRTDLGSDPAIEDWNGRMIPFVLFEERNSGDGVYAVVDSVEGTVGWDDTVSGMGPRLPSYYALMRAVADALEQGEAIDGRRPAVRGGVLRWDNVEYGNP
ncbi:hypothetical protein E1292_14425 [Nonomuraea deserti]|uniref:Knr4/Smi1-like domain-containing protein n=1 Tax=Nonomuraea deserti TaxID=1848322 RepID=A0A4R4VRM4_9ACTN|nr:SMI1/KNR4 family protein [Nonomuraea deserti]TDD06757.1 hypothetical protein E1292_14425 [Nonomuraea deserti]